MTRKKFAILGIVVVLLISLVGTAAAQTGTTPTAAVSADDAAGTGRYAHPIAQILAAYFGKEAEPETLATATPAETSTGTPTTEPTATSTPPSQEDLAKEIEAYHEEGIGYGVLVKLYAMAEASKTACPETPTVEETPVPGDTTHATPPCTAVTVDQLVQEFKSGTGMGQLFKEYGKPSLLGVGHVKQALREQPPQIPTVQPSSQATLENDEPSQPADQNNQQKNQKEQKDQKENKVKQHGNPNKVK